MTVETLALALGLLLLFPFLARWTTRRPVDWLAAPVVVALMLAVGYLGPLPSVFEGTDRFFSALPGNLSDLQGAAERALAVAIVATVAWYFGYYLVGRISGQPRAAAAADPSGDAPEVVWDRPALVRISVAYVVLGLGLFAVAVMLIGGPSVLLSGLGDRIRLTAGLNYLFQAIMLLLVVSILWWLYLLAEGRSLLSPVFWAYTLFAVAMNALQGSKSVIFVFVVVLGVLYHRMRRRVPTVIVLSGAAVLFGLLTAYALFAREFLVLGEFVTVETLDRETVLAVVRREATGNFIQLQTLMVLVDRVPRDLPFQFGTTYLALLALPVPRGIWPTKPLPSTGIFTLAFWPDSWLENGTTIPPGFVGELFLNFGIWGVALGMLLGGTIMRRTDRWARRRPQEPMPQACSALLLAFVPHYIRGDFLVTAALLILLLPLLFALKVAARREMAAVAPHPLPPADAAYAV